jgi:type I restriction enzyme S subunit
MSDDASKTLTPKLRFPEFREDPGWQEKPLKEVCKINPDNAALPESFVYIDLESVEGGVLKAKKRIERKDAPSRAQRLLRNGDVAFQIVRPYQRNNLFVQFEDNEKYVASTGYAQLRAHTGESFLYQAIHASSFVDRVIAKCTGSSYPAINSSDLAEICLPVPPSAAEQQKIADCLMSLDEFIAAQGKKVHVLKIHKKGLMQQLYPREDETVPRLRFLEFRGAPEWPERKASELFANRREDGEEGLPIYSVTLNDGMVPRASFDRDFFDIAAAGNKKACRGDIAYNMMRMWQGAQGVAVKDCMVSPAYIVLAPLAGVNSDFFAYLFKLPQSLRLLTAFSRGLTNDRLRLYFDDFARMPLRVPKFPEQQRIADCLLSLDARLTAEENKLAALRTQKKGLMQLLFPAAEAD